MTPPTDAPTATPALTLVDGAATAVVGDAVDVVDGAATAVVGDAVKVVVLDV